MVGAGVAIAGITNDFDGQNRPAMNPAIGADELVMAVPGSLQFGSATYSVGEGGGMVTLTVSRTGGSNGAVTADYTLASGTATGGATCAMGIDFVNTGGTVSFADGETSKTFDVAVCEDMDVEGNEMFTSTLSNATGGATIGIPATTTVTINDNDASMSGTLALSSATYSVGESTPSVSITVNRTNGISGAVTVNYSLTNGNATGGASCTTGIDFVNTGGTVSFADGEASKSFNVSICPDTLDEANETFNVTLSNPTGGAVLGTPTTAIVTINDDDPSPSLSINDVSQNEGNSGTSTFAFTVTLSSVSGQTVTVNYQTADGTATVANNDYVAIPSTALTFAPGETTKMVNVSVNGDTNVEPDETFSVNLSNATNATIADNQGVGTIQNEDATALSIADFNRLEGNTGTSNFTVTVTLSNITFQTVTVNYQTANGSATVAGNDYIAASGTLTFAPGELTKTLNVSVIGDITFEFDETFFVNLSNATNAAISDAQAVGTIINDDGQSFRINDVRIREGNAGTTAAIFTVTLTPDPNRPEGTNPTAATVQYRTIDGTATFPRGDYLTAIGTLTFNPGETQKTIEVLINGDTTKESNETFFVDIFSPINASIADPQGYGIIIDDDRPYLGDFDRDQKSDYSVYRPGTGVWYIFQSSNNFPKITPYGAVGDVAVPGDYDGDGVADIAVYRSSNNNWYILQSQGKIQTIVNWGAAGDIPVQADYDGDGKTDVAMFRPSDGKWYVIQSTNNARTIQQFGANGDLPVIGDFDGDFKNDLTVFRNGVWYVLRSSDGGVNIVNWGTTGDKPVSGDFDGDGKTDYAIYRNGTWWIFYSLTNSFSAINWGLATDIPAPADYDGDGTTDVAIFRPSEGNWYVLRSSDLSLTTIKWGRDGDIPGPSAYSPRR